jgi:cell division protein FtsI/penicillin-binding protein 2
VVLSHRTEPLRGRDGRVPLGDGFGFGLGASTGIDIAEAPGNIPPVAGTCVNSAQIAIGQGEVLVTPLQVASFFAALANGGTLYRPALVQRYPHSFRELTYVFSPDPLGQLPISEETLAAVAEGTAHGG